MTREVAAAGAADETAGMAILSPLKKPPLTITMEELAMLLAL
jgi:hypothetical protein